MRRAERRDERVGVSFYTSLSISSGVLGFYDTVYYCRGDGLCGDVSLRKRVDRKRCDRIFVRWNVYVSALAAGLRVVDRGRTAAVLCFSLSI